MMIKIFTGSSWKLHKMGDLSRSRKTFANLP